MCIDIVSLLHTDDNTDIESKPFLSPMVEYTQYFDAATIFSIN